MRLWGWSLGFGMLLSVTAPAAAQTESAGTLTPATSPASLSLANARPPHGARGQWLLGGTSHLTIAGGHFAHRSNLSVLPENLFGFTLSPSLAYFVVPRFAVGLTGDFEITRAPGTTAWALSVGPQAHGYISFGSRVGLLPTLALVYKRADADDTLALAAKVPVVVHLNDRISLSAGPQVSQDLWRHRAALRSTGYGLYVGIIAWL